MADIGAVVQTNDLGAEVLPSALAYYFDAYTNNVPVVITPSFTLVGPLEQTVLPTTPVIFDVLFGDLRTLVCVEFAGLGFTELVHDGSAFTVAYEKSSTRTAITSGYRYSVLRVPVWPDAPMLRAYAFSTTGNELAALGGGGDPIPPP